MQNAEVKTKLARYCFGFLLLYSDFSLLHSDFSLLHLFRADYEMNLADCADFVAIDYRHIAGRKMLQFSAPSRVGDFHPQHTT